MMFAQLIENIRLEAEEKPKRTRRMRKSGKPWPSAPKPGMSPKRKAALDRVGRDLHKTVLEGGGSRSRKASRQAAGAGEVAARTTGDGGKRPWPFPASKSQKVQRSSAKMMTQLGDKATKRFIRKTIK